MTRVFMNIQPYLQACIRGVFKNRNGVGIHDSENEAVEWEDSDIRRRSVVAFNLAINRFEGNAYACECDKHKCVMMYGSVRNKYYILLSFFK